MRSEREPRGCVSSGVGARSRLGRCAGLAETCYAGSLRIVKLASAAMRYIATPQSKTVA